MTLPTGPAARDEGPYDGPRTEPYETADLAEHIADLQGMLHGARARPVPAGRLLGLPELPDGPDGPDVWVDTAGAAALTMVEPRTITGWLARGGPKRCPFPAPIRILYRTYWPRSQITTWLTEYKQAE